MKKTLLIILNDVLSDIIKKGELIERYYNPGNLFDEVHILLLNNDKPDLNELKRSVGTAKLYVHNLPVDKWLIVRTLGWRPCLLKMWSKQGSKLAAKINPALIRCYGNNLNAFLTSSIKSELKIPYVISMHTNPAIDSKEGLSTLIDKIAYYASKSFEKVALKNADLVVAVYKGILPYLNKFNLKNVVVAYNMLNPSNLLKKEDYRIKERVNIISVGRQFKAKNPENIIKALGDHPKVHLTIIGNGPLHEYLLKITKELNLEKRIVFKKSVPNDELTKSLRDYDIFVVHSDSYGIPKTVLEALCTGMPVILNKIPEEAGPEYKPDFVYVTENAPESYRNAIKKLMEDHQLRENLGRNAYKEAQQKWLPAVTEKKYVEIYSKYLQE